MIICDVVKFNDFPLFLNIFELKLSFSNVRIRSCNISQNLVTQIIICHIYAPQGEIYHTVFIYFQLDKKYTKSRLMLK